MLLNLNNLQKSFNQFSTDWVDTPEYNSFLYQHFEEQADEYEALEKHNEIVAKHLLGYGEKAFRYVWALVLSQAPVNGKFLEIGVFKGSILALSQLVSKELNLNLSTYGLTPLNNTGDKYSKYDPTDYEYSIALLYNYLDLNLDNTAIIEGLSIDEKAKATAESQGPYDILYIDGGHDYDTVMNDIDLCDKILKPGGLLVMDDASSLLNLSKDHPGFPGHPDVGFAIRDRIDTDLKYKHLFACGHNRVWKKLT